MVEKILFEKSDELLLDFFRELNKKEKSQIGLMGGWAVHYLLETRGIKHMGSRDIDIFFDTKEITLKNVEQRLSRLGFHPHSTFRWVKIFHSETEKELSFEESKKHAMHNLSYVYFDIATPVKAGHSMPEPLLKKVFAKEKEFINIKGALVMIPSSRVLVEMKLKSIPSRTDHFKRAKDLADLYSLLEYCRELWGIKNGIRIKTIGLDKKLVKDFKGQMNRLRIDGSIAAASEMIGRGQNLILDLLQKI